MKFSNVNCSSVKCSNVNCSSVICSNVNCSSIICSSVICSNVNWSSVIIMFQYQLVQCSMFQCDMFHCQLFQCEMFQCELFQCEMFQYELDVENCGIGRFSTWNLPLSNADFRWLYNLSICKLDLFISLPVNLLVRSVYITTCQSVS